MFGPRETWPLWFVPLRSTFHDGFNWKVSEKFIEASERAAREREMQLSRFGMGSPSIDGLPITRHPALGGGKKVAADAGHAPMRGRMGRPTGGGRGKANRVLGREPGFVDDDGGDSVPLKRMNKRADEWGDIDDDEGDMW